MDKEYDPDDMPELTRLVKEAIGDQADKPFEPCIVYYPELDRIEVLTHDCSYAWIDVVMNIFEIFQDNYPEDREEGVLEEVGFAIWPAKRMCRYYGLSTDWADIKQLLDALETDFPWIGPQILIARQLLEQLDSTEVDLV
jgi:hypothetical protein